LTEETAAIFDLDGTLITFTFDVMGTRRAILKEVEGRGFDVSGLELSTPTQHILDTARLQADARGRPDDYLSLRAAAYSILDGFELKGSRDAMIFPGTVEALKALRARSVRLAVLTNSGRRASDAVLKRTGLAPLFEFVFTRDETSAMKPSPRGLLEAMATLGTSAASTYYVGDGLFDVAAAHLAGVRSIGVATGNYTRERLRNEGADFVVGSLSELPALLASFRPSRHSTGGAEGQNR
jgi:phosphoglycolate phosphatase